MQRVQEAHSRDMTAHPGGPGAALVLGRKDWACVQDPLLAQEQDSKHIFSSYFCGFPEFPPQYFHCDSEGKGIRKQGLA